MKRRNGVVFVLLAAVLLVVFVPLLMMFSASVMVPRRWARMARVREEAGHRPALAALRSSGAAGVSTRTPAGVRLRLHAVPLEGGYYGIAVAEAPSGPGAAIVEGGCLDRLVEAARRRWDADERRRRERERDGRPARGALVDWLAETGLPRDEAERVADAGRGS